MPGPPLCIPCAAAVDLVVVQRDQDHQSSWASAHQPLVISPLADLFGTWALARQTLSQGPIVSVNPSCFNPEVHPETAGRPAGATRPHLELLVAPVPLGQLLEGEHLAELQAARLSIHG